MPHKSYLYNKVFTLIIALFGLIFINSICFAANEQKKYILLIDSYLLVNESNNKNFEKVKQQIEKTNNCYLITESLDNNTIDNKQQGEKVIKNYIDKYGENDLDLIILCNENSESVIDKYDWKTLGKSPDMILNGYNEGSVYKILKSTYMNEKPLLSIFENHMLKFFMLFSSMLLIVIIMLFRNVEKRKVVEKRLKENEDQIKGLINATPDIICFKDESGKYIQANEAHGKFLNIKAIDYIGKSDEELLKTKVNSKDIMQFIESDKKAWEKGNVWRGEEKFIDEHGKSKFLDVIKIPFYNADGSEKGLGIIGRDITERKLNEELKKKSDENVKLLEQAKEYDKLKTEFFANVSHELRTPLNIMLSSFQLMELYINNGSIVDNGVGLKKRITVLKKNSLRLLKLINNIIDSTKIDSGFYEAYFKNCNIVSLIEETTLSVVEYMKSKEIELVFDTEVEEKIIACDTEKIERIMLNLLSNATKFTPSGGKVDVKVIDKKDSIIISIKDTGIGIPKEKQHLIFERFGQVNKGVNKNYEGSGIGLSLVKSLVQMHQGTIDVRSECGNGSEFIIELPCRIMNEQGKVENIQEINKEMVGLEFSELLTT